MAELESDERLRERVACGSPASSVQVRRPARLPCALLGGVSDAAWRAGLEERFVRWLEQDVTHLLPGGPHADVQARVAGRLRAAWVPDWSGVTENYGGTAGHHAAFLHAQKPHPGQVRAAARITELLDGSRLALDHTQLLAKNPPLGDAAVVDLDRAIQDRYSLRCAPHVIGVLHDTTEWVRRWLTVEVNSANDNPLFDPDSADVYSGGNFYGGHVAQAMDSLKVAVANVVDLLDRQIELMVDARFSNGLPSNLVRPDPDEDGLHHGFKGMQIAASAATAEALAGCMPAGVFSRSTESHNQDKVSMSAPAARSSRAVLEPASEVAAIHLLTACQAVDLRGPEQSSPACTRVRAVVRRECRFVDHDRALHRDVAAVQRMIADGQIPGAE